MIHPEEVVCSAGGESAPTTRPHLNREMGLFRSWAAAFGFVSIATGIFTAYGAMLKTSGFAGIWTWIIVAVGQFAVAVIFGLLASRIPMTGYAYQWVSRLTNPVLGWIMGWLSFAFLTIVVVAVDYTVASTILPALIGPMTGGDSWMITALIMLIQFSLVATSTRMSLRVNSIAVVFELLGVVGLILLLFGAGFINHGFHFENLWSTAPIPSDGYLSIGTLTEVGPWILATLLGSFTIVGFETAANLAEETNNPKQTVPKAMMISVGSVGVLGMLLLIVVTALAGDAEQLAQSSSPVADVVAAHLGSLMGRVLLGAIIVSIFSCGLMIMLSNSRLVWAMSRDERFPGWQVLSKLSPKFQTPLAAATTVFVLSQLILAIFANQPDALFILFAAGSLIPALIYAGTVAMYIAKRRVLPPASADAFQLPAFVEFGAVAIASCWLAYELSVFRDRSFTIPWVYVLLMAAIGSVYLAYLLLKKGGPRGLVMPDLSSIDAGFDGPHGVASSRRPNQQRRRQIGPMGRAG